MILGEVIFLLAQSSIYGLIITRYSIYNNISVWYVIKVVAEYAPALYTILMNLLTISDSFIVLNPYYTDKYPIEKIFYYFRPFFEVIAFIVILADVLPIVFGAYLWYSGDGDKDREIG